MDLIIVVPFVLFGVAFLFSMMGRGGGTLYIPILFWIGMDLKTQAIPLSLLLGLATSSLAAGNYAWKKVIDWRIAIPFGLVMILFAPLGAYFNLNLPEELLLIILAGFTAISTIPLIIGRKNVKGRYSFEKALATGISGGGALGFFAGLIGRGGGSFIVPLLYAAGVRVKTAAAVSAFAVACATFSSFISHFSMHAHPQWWIWALSAFAVVSGSRIGSNFMVEKLSSRQIRWIFIAINLGVATLLIIKDVILA